MVAKTEKLRKDLSSASSLIKAFERSASADFNRGTVLIRQGLSDIGVGLIGLAALAKSAAVAPARFLANFEVFGTSVAGIFAAAIGPMKKWGVALGQVVGKSAVGAVRKFGVTLGSWSESLRRVGRSMLGLPLKPLNALAATAVMRRHPAASSPACSKRSRPWRSGWARSLRAPC